VLKQGENFLTLPIRNLSDYWYSVDNWIMGRALKIRILVEDLEIEVWVLEQELV
jgi:hypothetical protein